MRVTAGLGRTQPNTVVANEGRQGGSASSAPGADTRSPGWSSYDAGQARAADLRRQRLAAGQSHGRLRRISAGSNRLGSAILFTLAPISQRMREVLYDVDLPVFRQPALDAQD